MASCLICGKEGDVLCSACGKTVERETLCEEFCTYRLGGGNERWDTILGDLTEEEAFRIIDALCNGFSVGKVTYYEILYLAKNCRYIKKAQAPLFLERLPVFLADPLTEDQKSARILGLALDVYTAMHEYEEAENCLTELEEKEVLCKFALHSMIIFLIHTREYERATKWIQSFYEAFGEDPYRPLIEKEEKDLLARKEGKYKDYMPLGENAEKYVAYMEKRGFTFASAASEEKEGARVIHRRRGVPVPIPREEYPKPRATEKTGFRSFVAFDVETTGISPTRDSIIELSAVKVIDGRIADTFSELVRPIDQKVSEEITALTGITDEEVRGAREIWQVFPDFAAFIEDHILVGYNSIRFDSRFLTRAGRYSNLVIQNEHFDVMWYALNFKKELGIKKIVKLGELGKLLNVENPRAHRALADAETTAKIYLKLLDLKEQSK